MYQLICPNCKTFDHTVFTTEFGIVPDPENTDLGIIIHKVQCWHEERELGCKWTGQHKDQLLMHMRLRQDGK